MAAAVLRSAELCSRLQTCGPENCGDAVTRVCVPSQSWQRDTWSLVTASHCHAAHWSHTGHTPSHWRKQFLAHHNLGHHCHSSLTCVVIQIPNKYRFSLRFRIAIMSYLQISLKYIFTEGWGIRFKYSANTWQVTKPTLANIKHSRRKYLQLLISLRITLNYFSIFATNKLKLWQN